LFVLYEDAVGIKVKEALCCAIYTYTPFCKEIYFLHQVNYYWFCQKLLSCHFLIPSLAQA